MENSRQAPGLRAAAHLLQVLCSAALFVWMFLAPFAWILRDGLGPASISTTGLPAVGRFLTCFYWGPVALGLTLLLLVLNRLLRPGTSPTSGPGESGVTK